MDGLIETSPLTTEPDNSRRAILIATVTVVALAGTVAFLLRARPEAKAPPPAYAADLSFSDLKMSQAQNFAGATITYVDGSLSNTGDKTVTRVIVQVTFSDAYGQVAQIEDVPIRILQTGPYEETADLSLAPLQAGQSKRFRLIFEHVSSQWNQAYPELKIAGVSAK